MVTLEKRDSAGFLVSMAHLDYQARKEKEDPQDMVMAHQAPQAEKDPLDQWEIKDSLGRPETEGSLAGMLRDPQERGVFQARLDRREREDKMAFHILDLLVKMDRLVNPVHQDL